jgi:hypothetical protein
MLIANTTQCVWLAVELVVVWKYYIETRNTPLEEIAKHFDGDDALVGGATGLPLDEIEHEGIRSGDDKKRADVTYSEDKEKI